MYQLLVLLLIIIFSDVNCSKVLPRDQYLNCSEISEKLLEFILGPAFNSRYMSINKPIIEEDLSGKGGKRKVGYEEQFYVDSGFNEEVEPKPAWEVNNHVEVNSLDYRNKRDVDYRQEWHCRSKIVWSDLGADYFPRYLRHVECLTKNCWFNIYKCKPRSFTVKLLRKKPALCVAIDNGHKIGTSGLPNDLKELWVWEERAVTFCCDCGL